MLPCIHMNTRSLMHKLDLITNVIEQLDFHPTFVAISETLLSSYDRSLVNSEGYKFFSHECVESNHGGVSVFIDQNHCVNVINVTHKYLRFEYLVVIVDTHSSCKVLQSNIQTTRHIYEGF